MTAIRWLFCILGLYLTASSCAYAQTPSPYDPFTQPVTSLRCEAAPADPTDGTRAAIELQFDEGDELLDGRSIEVGYDALGSPVSLVILASRVLSPGHVITEVLAVRFGARGTAAGFRVRRGINGSDSRDSMGRKPLPVAVDEKELLTPAEITKAKELAAWLWTRRCDKRPVAE